MADTKNLRTLPHNDEAEKAVLGALLLNQEAFDSVVTIIGASDFYQPANAEIFKAISEMKNISNKPVDIITLIDYLKKKGLLDKAGGYAYIASLTESVSVVSNTDKYAQMIKEMSIRRQLFSIGSRFGESAFDEKEDIYQILDESEQELGRLSEINLTDNQDYSIEKNVSDVVDRIIKRMSGEAPDDKILTGFQTLDKYTNGGLSPEDYVILAARPSIGKTAFGVSMIRNMIRDNKSVAFFSLEMSGQKITERLLSTVSKVKMSNIVKAQFDEDEFDKLNQAADFLYSKKLFIVDIPNIKLSELRSKARRMKREKNIDIIVIDYIGLIDPSLNANVPRHEVVSAVSKALKSLARELKIPVVALCQVSRDSEEREPILSNLRESGSIEQDADIVMFLHRKRMLTEEEKLKNAKDANGNATLQVTKVIVAKQRNGETGSFKVGYDAATTSFENISQSEEFIEPASPEKKYSK
ncbi:MAG: replicative DNA helicase [Candidatus Ornithospirochaeta sp.]|nr:replicative DNA helicase [Candidatus Ornithospirochaeta sp.]